jgi:hypothetical protein
LKELSGINCKTILLGKSMKLLILNALEAIDICKKSEHITNAQTRKSLKNIEEGKNLTEYTSLQDFFKKMGI